MARWWQDDAFFELIRDKEVLTRIIAEVAGETIAAANAGEKAKTMKKVVADHLGGKNGRHIGLTGDYLWEQAKETACGRVPTAQRSGGPVKVRGIADVRVMSEKPLSGAQILR